MKELSIEQKTKAYDEALKVLHKYDGANIMFSQSLKEEMFPELKESKDEKTRSEIIRFIQMEVDDEIVRNKWIAWIEKQGEQKPQGKSALEPIKEEKVDNANKVEPKFKVGDWIVWQDKCYKVNYSDCGYELVDQNGLSISLEYENIDENARLWDITKDAKDGDILVSLSRMHPFIFNGHYDEDTDYVYAYCGISDIIKDDSFYFDKYPDEEFKVWDSVENVRPATRNQRNLLFSKMKDSGYEWDSEKKELIRRI